MICTSDLDYPILPFLLILEEVYSVNPQLFTLVYSENNQRSLRATWDSHTQDIESHL
jgi:hypothetical protein